MSKSAYRCEVIERSRDHADRATFRRCTSYVGHPGGHRWGRWALEADPKTGELPCGCYGTCEGAHVRYREGEDVQAIRSHEFKADAGEPSRVRYGKEDIPHCAICGQAEDRPVHRVL